MAVQFAIGRSGSGKTSGCFRAIVEAMRQEPIGEPIYWILPKQATFQAERQLTCTSGLGAFCRARVLSFEMLGQEVLAACGGMAVPQITALGRQMILGHLLRQQEDQLEYFRSAAREVGLAAKLDATFAEIEQAGKSAADLANLIAEMSESRGGDLEGDSLLAKMRDLHRIYAAYTSYLGQDRLDPHRRLQQVLECVERASILRGTRMYVDGFIEFTDFERRLLAAAAKVCRSVQITLLLDPDSPVLSNPHLLPEEMSLFFRTEETYRRLWFTFQEAGVAIDEPVQLRQLSRFADPSLSEVEREMFPESRIIATPLTGAVNVGRAKDSDESVPQAPAPAIELIEAADRRTEVDAAARRIRDLLGDGLRLREIGLLVRNLDLYDQIIEASFNEHGLPYFVDRRRTAAHHPLLQFIRCVLLIALNDWPHEAVMTLLKTGLAGLSLDEADEVENYVVLHRIRGRMWASEEPWRFVRTMTRGGEDEVPAEEKIEVERIDALRRRVVDRIRPFAQLAAKGPATVKALVVTLFEMIDSFGVRQTIAQWMADATALQQHEQRGEHEQVWAEIVELFEQMVDLLGEEAVSLGDFLNVLDSGLEQFDLALTPPTVDQVLVGQVDRTITPPLRAVVLLGMNEGVFPRASHEDSVLSDRERQTLRQRRLEIHADTQRKLLDENLLGYFAFTRASERLIVTRSISDDAGRPLAASPFWARVQEMFPSIAIQKLERERRTAVEQIGTPRQLVTALMRWVRDEGSGLRVQGSGEAAEADPWPALYQWLATHECGDDAIDVMRYRAWKGLSYSNEAQVSPEIAGRLFPSPLEASVSQIETFATCPFKHFLQYGLLLRDREEQEVTQQDLSRLYHDILERIVRDMLRQHKDWAELEEKVADGLVRQYAQEVGKALKGELMLSSARNQYLLQRIEKTLKQVIAHQRAARKRGKFQSAYADVSFGPDSRLPAFSVRTPSGREIHLHGKIDRVDVIADEGDFAIIDYKLTGSHLSLDRVYHGIALQLLTYLLVLQANGEQLAGKKLTPAAAFYVRLLRKLEDIDHPDNAMPADDPRFELRIKPRGIFDARTLPNLDSELTTGNSDVVNAYVSKTGGFGYRDRSDVAESAEFAGLLAHVQRRLGELGDQILSGSIAIQPYRINRLTPCPRCDFRSVCRFDPAVNGYHHLPGMKRDEVLKACTSNTDVSSAAQGARSTGAVEAAPAAAAKTSARRKRGNREP